MSESFDLEPLLARLESDSLHEQAAALDEATSILMEFGSRVVHQFVHTNDRFIIWERLFRFGLFVMEPLKKVLVSADDPELRGMSAMVLLKLGDKTGVPVLLEIIETGDVLLCQAAYRLAEAQITEAGDRMIERLRVLKFTEKDQKDYIQCLLIALQRLGRTLPPDLVERFCGLDSTAYSLGRCLRLKSKPFTSVGRIAKIFNKVEHFAKVEMIIEIGGTQEKKIIFAVPLLEDGYEQASFVKDAWKKGAAAGIAFAMKQCDILSYTVTVTKIEGTYADTNPTIVGAAAIDAVWQFYHFNNLKERQRIEGIVRDSWNKLTSAIPDFDKEE